MKVLIVGGTGFLGRSLVPLAIAGGHEVTVTGRGSSRPHDLAASALYAPWSTREPLPITGPFDAIVSLAGASIGGARWTPAHKEEMRRSRIETNERLVDWCRANERRPNVFVTASAVGYYGLSTEAPVDETSPPGDDFLATLCKDWEDAARPAEALGMRVVMTRFGVMLGPDGGALEKMMLPFKLGFGGKVGRGTQPFPWIHRTDAVRAVLTAIDRDDLSGPVNVVAPERVTNEEFTKAFGDALRRPTIFPVPTFGLGLVYGEGAIVLTEGQEVVPRVLTAHHFSWQHPRVGPALKAIV